MYKLSRGGSKKPLKKRQTKKTLKKLKKFQKSNKKRLTKVNSLW